MVPERCMGHVREVSGADMRGSREGDWEETGLEGNEFLTGAVGLRRLALVPYDATRPPDVPADMRAACRGKRGAGGGTKREVPVMAGRRGTRVSEKCRVLSHVASQRSRYEVFLDPSLLRCAFTALGLTEGHERNGGAAPRADDDDATRRSTLAAQVLESYDRAMAWCARRCGVAREELSRRSTTQRTGSSTRAAQPGSGEAVFDALYANRPLLESIFTYVM